jgi:poly(A) polymerase
VLLQRAGTPGEAGPWKSLLELAQNWQRPRFPLTGRDVMQAGVPEGPQVGRVLAALENGWVEGDFAASEGDLRARLKVLAANA